jgi:hypothetical protein
VDKVNTWLFYTFSRHVGIGNRCFMSANTHTAMREREGGSRLLTHGSNEQHGLGWFNGRQSGLTGPVRKEKELDFEYLINTFAKLRKRNNSGKIDRFL